MKITSTIQAMSLSVLLATSCTTTETNSTENNTTTEAPKSSETTAVLPNLETLEKSSDVLWMGETEVDYALDYNRWDYDKEDEERILMENLGFKTRNSFKVLKYQVNDLNDSDNDDHELFNKILQNRKDMQFYKDAGLEIKYSSKDIERAIGRVDTIIVFDPKTMKEETQVVVNVLDPETVKAFRVRQVVYYNEKEMTFKSIALAVAPLAYEEGGTETPSPENLKPLFWMKANALVESLDLGSSNITWAKRMYRNFDFSAVKVIKQEQDISVVLEKMMEGFRANAKTTKIAHTFKADGSDYLTPEEVQNLGASVDTVITFDPNTFAEKTHVITQELKGKDIESLRLLQDWVWDDNTKSLSIRYVGFAPIISRFDENGQFLNSGPMFVRRAEDIQ